MSSLDDSPVEVRLYYDISGRDLDPDMVTNATRITPDKVSRTGDKFGLSPNLLSDTNTWFVYSGLAKEAAFASHMEQLLSRLEPGWDRLRQLGAQYEALIEPIVRTTLPEGPEMVISREAVQRLTQLNVEMVVDLYAAWAPPPRSQEKYPPGFRCQYYDGVGDTDDEYVARSFALYSLRGPDLDPRSVTNLTGINPTSAWRRSEGRHSGGWQVALSATFADILIGEQLDSLFGRLDAAWSELTGLGRRVDATIECGIWVPEATEGFSITRDAFRRMTELNATFHLKIFQDWWFVSGAVDRLALGGTL